MYLYVFAPLWPPCMCGAEATVCTDHNSSSLHQMLRGTGAYPIRGTYPPPLPSVVG